MNLPLAVAALVGPILVLFALLMAVPLGFALADTLPEHPPREGL